MTNIEVTNLIVQGTIPIIFIFLGYWHFSIGKKQISNSFNTINDLLIAISNVISGAIFISTAAILGFI